MDNGPGISLFQGSESLQLDANTQRQEEEEAIADQQLRDQELHNLLSNAFDDLYEEDEDDQSTISSSHHFDSIIHDEDDDHGGDNFRELGQNLVDARFDPYQQQHDGVKDYILPDNHTDNSQSSEHLPHTVNTSPPNSSAVMQLEAYMNQRNLAESHAQQELGSGDASVSALHYQHCYRTSPGTQTGANEAGQGDASEQYLRASYNSMEQLEILYGVRVREVQRLSDQLVQQEQEAAHEKDQLYRKLALREAEKERAQMQYKQVQSLLVDSKETITKQNNEVETLKTTVNSLEKSKSELTFQFEASQASVSDLHQKVSLLERGQLNSTDKHMDAFLRNIQASHNQELKKLEDAVQTTVVKLSKKEQEFEELERHLQNRVRELEARLLDKGDTVNQLVRSLEESQRQCQALMGSTAGQDIMRLTLQLETATKEKEDLQNKVQDLTHEMETLCKDLQRYEAVVKLGLLNFDEPEGETDSMVGLGIRTRGSGKSNSGFDEGIRHTADLNAKMRDELQRCLIGQKLKREEIERLRAQIASRDLSITALKKQEMQYLAEATKFKAEYTELLDELKKQKELAKKTDSLKQRRSDLETSLKKLNEEKKARSELEEALAAAKNKEDCVMALNKQLQSELAELQQALEEERQRSTQQHAEEYLKFHDQAMTRVRQELYQEHEAAVTRLRVQLEDACKESDRTKQLYIEVCGSKDDLTAKLLLERQKVEHLAVQLQAETECREAEKRALDILPWDKGEVSRLRNELQKERIISEELKGLQRRVQLEMEEMRKHHDAAILQMQADKEKAVKNTEERVKQSFSTQVTEELEKAKVVTLAELERDWSQRREELSNEQAQQVEAECSQLREELKTLADLLANLRTESEGLKRRLEDTEEKLRQEQSHGEQLEHSLKEKEELLSKPRPPFRSVSTSPVPDSSVSDVEQLKRELTLAFREEVSALETQHQLHVEEVSERIKDETVKFFAQWIQQLEAKHRTELDSRLQRAEKAYQENVAVLRAHVEERAKEVDAQRASLLEERSKLYVALEEAEAQWKVRVQTLEAVLQEQRSHLQVNDAKWKGKVEALEAALKEEHARPGAIIAKEMGKVEMPEADLVKDHTCPRSDNAIWKARAEALAAQMEENLDQFREMEQKAESLQIKYNAAKKIVRGYKEYVSGKEKHLKKEWERISSGYRHALELVQSKAEAVLAGIEAPPNAKVEQFTQQIATLKHKMFKEELRLDKEQKKATATQPVKQKTGMTHSEVHFGDKEHDSECQGGVLHAPNKRVQKQVAHEWKDIPQSTRNTRNSDFVHEKEYHDKYRGGSQGIVKCVAVCQSDVLTNGHSGEKQYQGKCHGDILHIPD